MTTDVIIVSDTDVIIEEVLDVDVIEVEGDTDTDVILSAEQGPPGPQGDQGIQGIQGIQGAPGVQGPAGSDAAVTAANVGAVIAAATAKATPVDADSVGLSDSAASNVLKKLTWANVKATLKTYFDTLYLSTIAPLVLAANLVEQKNGATAQTLRLYNIDSANYERLGFTWTGTRINIQTQQAGSGASRPMGIGTTGTGDLIFTVNGGDIWYIEGPTGHLKAGSDNVRDIGASAAARPRTVYVATSVETPAVKFPATQVASADANTLDDYEEGTWTPVLSFGGATTGITYSSREAVYTKIGRTVHFRFYILLSSKGSAVGNALVLGLPFTNGAGLSYNGVSVWIHALTGISGAVTGYVHAGGNYIVFQQLGTGSAVQLDETNFTNSTAMMISGTYSV